MIHPRRTVAVALLTLVCSLGPAASAFADGRVVPQGFLGTMADGPVFDSPTRLETELGQMSLSGVEAVRVAWRWSEIQPYETAEEIPAGQAGNFTTVDGVPNDFQRLDEFVTATARHGLQLVPVIFETPSWARLESGVKGSPPAQNSDYARVMSALVGRYGNRGTFWDQHPELTRTPIPAWQIWNEPDIRRYWSTRPFAPSYVKLLRAASRAVIAADDEASVLLGGLTNLTWKDLEKVYKAGGAPYFDAVTVNQFSLEPSNLMKAYRRIRKVMRRYDDDDKPMRITELTWPSAKRYKTLFRYGFEVSEKGQTERLEDILSTLIENRGELRLEQVLWYTWLSPNLGSNLSFDYSGLRRLNGAGSAINKPALESFEAFALDLEGCSKTTIATQCEQ